MKKLLSLVSLTVAILLMSTGVSAANLNFYDSYRNGTYTSNSTLEAASYTTNPPVLYLDFTPTLSKGQNSYGNMEYYISHIATKIGIQMGSVPPMENKDVAFMVKFSLYHDFD